METQSVSEESDRHGLTQRAGIMSFIYMLLAGHRFLWGLSSVGVGAVVNSIFLYIYRIPAVPSNNTHPITESSPPFLSCVENSKHSCNRVSWKEWHYASEMSDIKSQKKCCVPVYLIWKKYKLTNTFWLSDLCYSLETRHWGSLSRRTTTLNTQPGLQCGRLDICARMAQSKSK